MSEPELPGGELITLATMALEHNAVPETFETYFEDGVLPEPDVIYKGVPLWLRDTIRDWDASRHLKRAS